MGLFCVSLEKPTKLEDRRKIIKLDLLQYKIDEMNKKKVVLKINIEFSTVV